MLQIYYTKSFRVCQEDIFKKEGKSVFSKDTISDVLKTARDAIVEQAKKAIPGQEKKDTVDIIVTRKVQTYYDACSNGIVRWVIEQFIKAIPTITQIIYDRLKETIINL